MTHDDSGWLAKGHRLGAADEAVIRAMQAPDGRSLAAGDRDLDYRLLAGKAVQLGEVVAEGAHVS